MQHAIVYQAYGSSHHINECRYALLKFLQAYNLRPPKIAIIIYTDAPEAFVEFKPFFHELILRQMEAEEIKRWRGPVNFVHRVKIKMLQDCFEHFNGSLLYCDTDTCITSPIENIFEEIGSGRFCMHQYEGQLQDAAFKKWNWFLKTANIEYKGRQLEYSPSLKVWNAGVVGISFAHRHLLDEVLALTDSIYSRFPKHIAEQFAFSYCFQKNGTVLSTAEQIAHYWNLKEFRQLLALFFSKYQEESIPSLVRQLSHLNAWDIQQNKNAYRRQGFLKKIISALRGRSWSIRNYEKKI